MVNTSNKDKMDQPKDSSKRELIDEAKTDTSATTAKDRSNTSSLSSPENNARRNKMHVICLARVVHDLIVFYFRTF